MKYKISILLVSLFSFKYCGSSSNTEVAVIDSDNENNKLSEKQINDLLIVGTADGFIRAIDADNNEKWNVDTGGPIASAFNSDDQPYSVLPSVDGTIYIHNREGMTKTSVKARMIAEKAPFISSQDNLVFTGQKSSKILGVDISNGKITHDSSKLGSRQTTTSTTVRHPKDSLLTNKLDRSIGSSLWLGRTDYSFRAFDRSTGLEHFNMTFSELKPLSIVDMNTDSDPFYSDSDAESAIDSLFGGETLDEVTDRLLYDEDSDYNIDTDMLPSAAAANMKNVMTRLHNEHKSQVSSRNNKNLLTDGTVNNFDRYLQSLQRTSSPDSPVVVSAFAIKEIKNRLSNSRNNVIDIDSDHENNNQQFDVHPLRLTTDSYSLQKQFSPSKSSSSTIKNKERESNAIVLVDKTTSGSLMVRDAIDADSHKTTAAIINNKNNKKQQKQISYGVLLPKQSKQSSKSSYRKYLIQLPASSSSSSSSSISRNSFFNKRKSTQQQFIQYKSSHSSRTHELLRSQSDSDENNNENEAYDEVVDDDDDDEFTISHNFFEADGRMCIPPHYVMTPDSDSPQTAADSSSEGNTEETAESFLNLPSCLHGNHRLLPALVSDQQRKSSSNIALPHFIQSVHQHLQERAEAAAVLQRQQQQRGSNNNNSYQSFDGDAFTAAEKSRLKLRKEPMSLFRMVIWVSDFLGLVFIFTAVCVGLFYVLYQQGIISNEFVRHQYIAFLSFLHLNEILVLPSSSSSSVLLNNSSDNNTTGSSIASSTVAVAGVSSAANEEDFYYENGNKFLRVGSIVISPFVLGYGSSGTVVFRGSLNGRSVAVKRLLTQFNWTAEREIGLLIKSDGHPNVVRYFLSERRGDFVYLCLQLCSMSLKDFVTRLQQFRQLQTSQQSSSSTTTLTQFVVNPADLTSCLRHALQQVAEGLAHLHAQRIVHRDIKPHNILCALPELDNSNTMNNTASTTSMTTTTVESIISNKNNHDTNTPNNNNDSTINSITELCQLGDYVLKISDMGLSKQLSRDQESVSGMSFSLPNGEPSLMTGGGAGGTASSGNTQGTVNINPVGTIGWQAPELIALRGQSSLFQKGGNTNIINNSNNDDNNNDDELNEGDNLSALLEEESTATSVSVMSTSATTTMTNATIDTSATATVAVLLSTQSLTQSQQASGNAHNTPAVASSSSGSSGRFRPQNVDIFSLGCVFYYVLTEGSHPFGQWFEREANIMMDRCDLSVLNDVPEAYALVSAMIAREPRNRPSARQVCHHPFFWSATRRLDFFVNLSDRLELESPDALPVLLLETEAQSLLGRGWNRKLDPQLLEDMGRYRKYDSCSVRDLLRVIRNKRNHYNELSENVKYLVGDLPEGFIMYFELRFPKLLLHCLRVACTYYANEKDISMFCIHIVSLFKVNTSSVLTTSNASATTAVMSQGNHDNHIGYNSNGNSNYSTHSQTPLLTRSASNSTRTTTTTNTTSNDNNLLNTPVQSPFSIAITTPTITPQKINDFNNNNNNNNNNEILSPMSSSTYVQAVESSSSSCMNAVSVASEMMSSSNHDKSNNNSCESSSLLLSPLEDESASTAAAVAAVNSGNIVVWHGSGFATSCKTIGWWRDDVSWINQPGSRPGKPRPSHLTRSATDAKYRSRLCSHWDKPQECHFRKKGKCDFAHGPLELRVKDTRRDKWGHNKQQQQQNYQNGGTTASSCNVDSSAILLLQMQNRYSGGEDVLGAARSIEKIRARDEGGPHTPHTHTPMNNSRSNR